MSNKKSGTTSIRALEKAVHDDLNAVHKIEWRGMEIEIREGISLQEVTILVEGVVRACFDEDDNYRPEVQPFVLKDLTIGVFTNIALPSDSNKRYAIIRDTDLFQTVVEYINEEQFYCIKDAIDERIQYRCQMNISTLSSQVNEVVSTLSDLSKQIESMFSGVTSEDLQRLVGAMSNGEIDATKLMSAYLEEKYGPDDTKPDE